MPCSITDGPQYDDLDEVVDADEALVDRFGEQDLLDTLRDIARMENPLSAMPTVFDWKQTDEL